MLILSINPHLTLTLSPPIGWERRGDRRRTRFVPRRSGEQRQVHGANARQNFGVEANLNLNPADCRKEIKIKIKIRSRHPKKRNAGGGWPFLGRQGRGERIEGKTVRGEAADPD